MQCSEIEWIDLELEWAWASTSAWGSGSDASLTSMAACGVNNFGETGRSAENW